MSDEERPEVNEFDLPPLPEGEWDGDRHVSPYVQDREPDPSAFGYVDALGEEVTQEERSHQSRLAFHVMESLMGSLTPLGCVYVLLSMCHSLHPELLADEMRAAGTSPEALDPRGEILPFADLHRARLDEIHRLVEEMAAICPRCGRRHDGEDALQPGGYVNTKTGESVNVTRVEEKLVYCLVQVAEDRTIDRQYDRPWFEENFVPGESVEVLG